MTDNRNLCSKEATQWEVDNTEVRILTDDGVELGDEAWDLSVVPVSVAGLVLKHVVGHVPGAHVIRHVTLTEVDMISLILTESGGRGSAAREKEKNVSSL